MGNVESTTDAAGAGGGANYWHGRAISSSADPLKGIPPISLQRKGSSFLDEPIVAKHTERGESEVTLSRRSDGREATEGGNSDGGGCAGRPERKLRYAVSEMQGWRSHMEDQCALNPTLATNRQQAILLKDHHLFAVFDGHGGDFASKFCGENLVSTLVGQRDWQRYLSLSHASSSSGDAGGAGIKSERRDAVLGLTLLKSALRATFLALDAKLMVAQRTRRVAQLTQLENLIFSLGGNVDQEVFREGTEDRRDVMNFERVLPLSMPPNVPLERSGSTGVVVLITPSHIICANAGDSRAILSRKTAVPCPSGGVRYASGANGEGVLPLSFDHKPSNDVEVCRVERDGGFVRSGRVDGDLAVSRAFGDFGYKNCDDGSFNGSADAGGSVDGSYAGSTASPGANRVTVDPDIIVQVRDPDRDEFMVLACDGIWDRLSNRDCASLVRTLVHNEGESDVGLVCEEVIDTALEMDSRDNMTCCLVIFPGMDVRKGGSSHGVGVVKRRIERERSWGSDSTAAKRAQQRLEERRRKNREMIAQQRSMKKPKTAVQHGKRVQYSDTPRQ